jgi:hypothetical protein
MEEEIESCFKDSCNHKKYLNKKPHNNYRFAPDQISFLLNTFHLGRSHNLNRHFSNHLINTSYHLKTSNHNINATYTTRKLLKNNPVT